MGDGLRTIRVVTTDESLMASARACVSALEGWEVAGVASVDELLQSPPMLGDVLLVDSWLRNTNVYEACRRLTGNTRCRTFVVVDATNRLAEPIARFCGATGVLHRPLVPSRLREALASAGGKRAPLPKEARGQDNAPAFPEKLLVDLNGKQDESLVAALTDPETGLFSYGFLSYKLDEEFKRARRFGQPLSCVMLGFEGQVNDEVLREFAGIFLETSRDTDVLGRFDESSFLFFLPNTGPDGARVMARRVGDLAQQRGLRDLVGDPVVISAGIATMPNPDIQRREDLFALTRRAYFAARQDGGGVVVSS
ncbi:MAG: diguanylate cyclase [Planctomycetes bacterium]|nr:diguanylate cyclase [Planctomycetota bacterium]